MLIPLLAVILTQLIFKERILGDIGLSFKLNRWWLIGWLLIPVLSFAILGVSLLMPGAHWAPDGEMVRRAMAQMPAGIGLGGFLALSTLSGLLAGATINAVLAFGEEAAWRGWLQKQFENKSLPVQSLIIGSIWGLWHFPLILNGHNYPQHPVAGVFMMVLLCILMTPLLLYFRKKSGSVIVPAIMHGSVNALVGISNLLVEPANDLLIGGPGLAGMLVFLLTDLVIFLLHARKA
jgi:membrane protease YdiL (CAAX protease family)